MLTPHKHSAGRLMFSMDGIEIGEVSICKGFKGRKEIVNVEITKDLRGKGYGTQMMWEVMQYLVNSGVKEAELAVYKRNIAAIKAYRNAGFVTLVNNPVSLRMLWRNS